LRRITIHDLRHSFASALRTSADAKHLQDFLGHASPAMTDHYTHLTPEAKVAMVGQIQRLFWG